MLVILFIIALAIYFKIGLLAFKLAWGIAKIVFALVLSPLLFIGLIIGGLAYGAIVLLAIMGIIMIIASIAAAAT